jgi:hypothetical protein
MRFDRFRRGVFCRFEPARRFSNYRRFVKTQLRKVPDHFDEAKTYDESEADDYDQRSQKMRVPPVARREPLDANSVSCPASMACPMRATPWRLVVSTLDSAPHEIETEGMESTEDYRSC